MISRSHIAFFLFLILTIACNKEDTCACTDIYQPVCAEGVTFGNACLADCAEANYRQGACNEVKAVIEWQGNVALDGCGWVIIAADTTYGPRELDESFQEDDLEVFIDFEKTNQQAPVCWGFLEQIDIRSIRRR